MNKPLIMQMAFLTAQLILFAVQMLYWRKCNRLTTRQGHSL